MNKWFNSDLKWICISSFSVSLLICNHFINVPFYNKYCELKSQTGKQNCWSHSLLNKSRAGASKIFRFWMPLIKGYAVPGIICLSCNAFLSQILQNFVKSQNYVFNQFYWYILLFKKCWSIWHKGHWRPLERVATLKFQMGRSILWYII